LKYDPALIRFRWLDPSLSVSTAGLDDLSVPLRSFQQLSPAVERVFVTENKINGLSLPACPRSMVIFGLGYGIECLADISWLKNKVIHYWGDIDTHGFSILARLRKLYPQVQSFLMDTTTLHSCTRLWGTEPDSARFQGELNSLTQAEQQLYQELLDNRYAINLRLEQERIPFPLVLSLLHEFPEIRLG
jgi:hypothetical protein